MVNRAQCSLIIDDNDLYENLVKPLKLNKQLAPFILKLLGVYYYNENLRDAIDGAPEYRDESFENDIKQLFKETREAFYMLDYCTQSANGSIKEGIKQMKEMISSNPDDFGKPIGKLPESPQDAINEALKEGQERKESESERLTNLETSVSDLSSKMDLILEKLCASTVTQKQQDVPTPKPTVAEDNEPYVSPVFDFETNNNDSSDDDNLLVIEEPDANSEANSSMDGVGLIKGLLDSIGM